MVEENELNVLISNIVSERRYSNCRLCLKNIQDKNYVRLEDSVLVDSCETYEPMGLVLCKLLGTEMSEAIPGLDALCPDCADQSLATIMFIQKCKDSTKLVHNVLNNLMNALDHDVDVTDKHKMYITVNENDAKLILVNNDQKKDNPKDKKYYCSECSEKLESLLELKMHNITVHAKLTCEKCLDLLTCSEEQYFHESSKKQFDCRDCSVYRCTEESLNKHRDNVHGVYVCKACGKSFRGLDRLQSHELKHVRKSECPKCGKTYNTRDFFLKHVKLCLDNLLDPHPIRSKMEKKYFCDKCNKGYSTPGGLRVHIRFVHGNAKPHTCEYCQKQFTAPSYLKVHMVKHTGEKNFKCDLCNKNFVSREALLYHTRRHTGEKPYSCTMCEEKFVNASARAEHIKFKHVGPTLMCEICSRKFVTPNFLRQHIKKHHDPSNKLYAGRSLIPANVPAVENMRVKIED